MAFLSRIEKRSGILLFSFIVFFCLVSTLLVSWKYFHFQYNALDLAIYSQVLFNTSEGRWFDFSIHPHSYLADHLDLGLIFFVPFFRVFPSPLTLLVLQNILLALCAWPIYKSILALYRSKPLALAVAVFWIFNPFVHNIATFEWHLLPVALFSLWWMIYFYIRKKFWPFLALLGLSLLMREDVALLTAMFGILALVERRSWRWILTPFFLSVAYFFSALHIIAQLNPDNTYKFLYYYSWIPGETLAQKLSFLSFHPWELFFHLGHIGHIIFFLALFTPFAFVPLVRPKYLLLGIPVLLQLLMTSFYGNPVLLQTHYATLLLPPIFLALASALFFTFFKEKPYGKTQEKIHRILTFDLYLTGIVLFSALIYGAVTWGSFARGGWEAWKNNPSFSATLPVKKALLQKIDPSASVASSFEFLPPLSQRQKLFSLHYAFIGQRQYSQAPYQLPDDVDTVIMNDTDILFYQSQFSSPIYQENYSKGFQRLDHFLKDNHFGMVGAFDSYTLWKKNQAALFEPYEITDKKPLSVVEQSMGDDLILHGFEPFAAPVQNIPSSSDVRTMPFSFFWRLNHKTDKNYQLHLHLRDRSNEMVYEKKYALAAGLYPTSVWNPEEIVKTNHIFAFPTESFEKATSLDVSIFLPGSGYLSLNAYSTAIQQTEDEVIGNFRIPL